MPTRWSPTIFIVDQLPESILHFCKMVGYLPLAASLFTILFSQSVHADTKRVLDTDFPDPCVIKTDAGYYAFGTAGNGVNVQVARSEDFSSWELLSDTDALPGPFPDWVASEPNTWAPDVIKRVCIQKTNLRHAWLT